MKSVKNLKGIMALLPLLLAGSQARIAGFQGRILPGSVTVSGISSGGGMATQFHVAFSETVQGAGVIAGVPYHCAQGTLLQATYCMTLPSLISVSSLVSDARSFESSGKIDDLSNLEDDRVYIYHANRDATVNHGAGVMVEEFYANFLNRDQMLFEDGVDSSHGHPTKDYGDTCYSLFSTTYLLDCNYDAAFEALNFLYGGDLNPPAAKGTTRGTLSTFGQGEFISGSASSISMGDTGYIYVPTKCEEAGNSCRLHVAFHGCKQDEGSIGDVYVRHAGYIETADANDIVVLFPQAKTSLFLPQNPNGCWDWWGYDDSLFADKYATKDGPQMEAVFNMIQDLMAN